MSFGVWFKMWIASFFKLLTFDVKKHKSDAQRKRERERRLKARFSSANYYRIKENRRKRRSSESVENERLIGALFKFTAVSLGVLLLPFGLLDWGRKSFKARKASTGNKTPKKASLRSNKTANSNTSKTNRKIAAQHSRSAPKAIAARTSTTKQESIQAATPCFFEFPESKAAPPGAVKAPTAVEPDEDTPKSTPKNESDQYIRKRMIIAGSYYCEKSVLDTLKVGSYIDLEAEPDNPYDKDAVKLLYNGQKIGYIAKDDRLAFITCLKLNRNIYGAITAIIEEGGQTKYEYETWFDNR